MKLCNKCGTSHPATKQYFGVSDGYLTSPCNPCRNEARRQRHKANPQKYKRAGREQQVKRDYGLTPEEYDAMLVAVDGKCTICRKAPKVKALAVDHCHTTGKVRGILCDKCNMGIGYFDDNLDLLQKAIEYLKENQ